MKTLPTDVNISDKQYTTGTIRPVKHDMDNKNCLVADSVTTICRTRLTFEYKTIAINERSWKKAPQQQKCTFCLQNKKRFTSTLQELNSPTGPDWSMQNLLPRFLTSKATEPVFIKSSEFFTPGKPGNNDKHTARLKCILNEEHKLLDLKKRHPESSGKSREKLLNNFKWCDSFSQ